MDARLRLRGRILAAMGLGGISVAAFVAACGSSNDTVAGSDAAVSDGAMSDGGGSDGGRIDGAMADAGAEDGYDGNVGNDADIEDAKPDVPSVRRPFLVGQSMRFAGASRRDDWGCALPEARDIDPRTRKALGAAWLQDALEEHASIAAFARFSLHLLACGAPPDLVEGSQRAALGEIEHARGCFALARRYGAGDVGPSALSLDGAVHALSLAELADLTVREGCVGETLGALCAAEQLAHARDPEVIAFMERVARDEDWHAELAWKFVAWAIRTGGAEVAQAVKNAFARAIADATNIEIRTPHYDIQTWHAHGRVTCREAHQIAANGIRDVIEPCMQALFEHGAVPDIDSRIGGGAAIR